MPQYDILIVGAGLYGATLAHLATNAGKRVLVVERRDVVGGNCYDALIDGQMVNRYGGHIFHTNNRQIWDFVHRFGEWRHTAHTVLAKSGATYYSFPINLMTLQQLWGVTNAGDARMALDLRRQHWRNPNNSMEDYCLHHLGEELYETFIRGYTWKQWRREPAQLPASIIKRIPVRLDKWNGRYFQDEYEGVPVDGYTAMIERMLDGVDVHTGADYIAQRQYYDAQASVTVFSGALDELYNYQLGKLDYRSLRFVYETRSSLGVPTVNYPERRIPHTRQVDFAAIRREKHDTHVIMTEYPANDGDPMYPIRDAANSARHAQYMAMAESERVFVGGRLGAYQYLDMHQAIGMAMKDAKTLCD